MISALQIDFSLGVNSSRRAGGDLLRDARGSVAALGAAVVAALLAAGALGVELGDAYVAKARNQRVADVAAIGAALSGQWDSANAVAQNSAMNLVLLNGLLANNVVAAVASSPTGDGENAAQVDVTTSIPLNFARVLGFGAGMNVSSRAIAEFSFNVPACVVGLSPSGIGYSQSGTSTSLTLNGCSVASVSNMSFGGGTSLTAAALFSGGTVTQNGSSTITTQHGVHQNYSGITDPVANTTATCTATWETGAVSCYTALTDGWAALSPSRWPTQPIVTNITGNPDVQSVTTTQTLPCGAGNTYTIGSISVPSGAITLVLASNCTYQVKSGISVGNGGSLTVTSGTGDRWIVNGGISIANGGSAAFGSATSFAISAANNSAAIGNAGSLTFAPVTTFNVSGNNHGGISNSGTLTISANAYYVSGAVTLTGTTNWLTTGNSAVIYIYDSGGLFSNSSSGSPVLSFGDGTYYVNGGFSISSASVFFDNSNSVALLINGPFSIGANAELCGTTPLPASAATFCDVAYLSIIDNDYNNLASGSTVNVSGPLAGMSYGIVPTSGSNAGILMASACGESAYTTNTCVNGSSLQSMGGGASAGAAGLIYFPGSTINFAGNTDASSVLSQRCFEIVANVVNMTGNATTADACNGFSNAQTIILAKLVQ